MDLFEYNYDKKGAQGPLAETARPLNLEDFVGHQEKLGVNSPLLKSIQSNMIVPNLILWGPPGCGKTTFALLLKGLVDSHFEQVNAVDTGAKRLKEIGQEARQRKIQFGKPTILFVDEIHRFNRAQQDVLLPFTEKGDFSLIGATTENPSYELNSALLSRCKVIVLNRHSKVQLQQILSNAILKENFDLKDIFEENTLDVLLDYSEGDARKSLNALEQVLAFRESNQNKKISIEDLHSILNESVSFYDKKGDEHYNCISAFIKSIRGSDPDAGLYYLARMLKGGEDPVFIARRLVILASEDVGNADPRALNIAVSGLQAVELVGLPEASINLAQVVTYLASAPKSNRSYKAWLKAQSIVSETGNLPIPKSLRSSQTKLAKELGFGKGYKYSHDSPKGFVSQNFMPEQLSEESLYEPIERGFEKNIIQYLKWLKE